MKRSTGIFVVATALLSVTGLLRSDASAQDAPLESATKGFVGQLTLTNADGEEGKYCSGAFVHEQVIITAAHCVRENGPYGRPHTVLEFEQQDGNTYPLSTCITYPPEWATVTHQYLRIPYDYAFIRLQGSSTTTIFLEGIGRIKGENKKVRVFGYPAEDSLDSEVGQPQEDVIHPEPVLLEITDTEFGRGTSGGPWIAKKSANKFYAAGVNSSYIEREIKAGIVNLYGPDLEHAQDHLDRAIDNCPN